MPAYWLGIMAVGVAVALALWIILVLRADRKIPDKREASSPPREIIGGQFRAWRGGRQVMPDPNESIMHGSGDSAAEQPVRERPIPEQRKAIPEEHEQGLSRGSPRGGGGDRT